MHIIIVICFSSPEPLGQFQFNLVQSIFFNIKEPCPFSKGIIIMKIHWWLKSFSPETPGQSNLTRLNLVRIFCVMVPSLQTNQVRGHLSFNQWKVLSSTNRWFRFVQMNSPIWLIVFLQWEVIATWWKYTGDFQNLNQWSYFHRFIGSNELFWRLINLRAMRMTIW